MSITRQQASWYNNAGRASLFLVADSADHLLEFRARHHDEMAASLALEPEVHAGAQNFPFA